MKTIEKLNQQRLKKSLGVPAGRPSARSRPSPRARAPARPRRPALRSRAAHQRHGDWWLRCGFVHVYRISLSLSVYSRCCMRKFSAIVGVPHRPLSPSPPRRAWPSNPSLLPVMQRARIKKSTSTSPSACVEIESCTPNIRLWNIRV